jgi:hypothetical protein
VIHTGAQEAARLMRPLEAGVWGVLPTPFTERLEVDEASLIATLELFLHARVTGVLALGVFGTRGSSPGRPHTAGSARTLGR